MNFDQPEKTMNIELDTSDTKKQFEIYFPHRLLDGDLVVLVDEQDQQLGLMPKMEAHEKAVLHRAFSVFRVSLPQGQVSAVRIRAACGPPDAVQLLELCELDHDLGYRVMSHAFEMVARDLSDCRVRLLDIYGHA